METKSFVCPRCGNSDLRYVGYRNGEPYCRKCISFHGGKAKRLEHKPHQVEANLHYSLTEEQALLSTRLVKNFINKIDSLVYAVCGSGKTEISYGVIAYALRHGLQVGFALPRRDVVIELFWRIKEAFPTERVVAVYGEHSYLLEGDIIILTTHQLYRYVKYFDLLVMDEIDAFPFKDNDTLASLYKASLRGNSVLLSATPSKEVLDEYHKPGHEVLELRTRFHHHEIPVPKIVLKPELLHIPYLVKKIKGYKKKRLPCFIFTPSIAKSEELFSVLSLFVEGGEFVNSKRNGREKIISDFKKGKFAFLCTTSVLERGVTVKDLQVIVTSADEEKIYDQSSLIQISGRAGRKMEAPDGEVIFLARSESKSMKGAVEEIVYCNSFL
ncbi:MAG: hypothetical protein LKF58_00090 [Bacilli bacterium]|nr:hypothetical protein [Bacilli bacterium]MCH4210168.1 hypothetical protein [Bacilli bacterium]MCH4278266.1 hypothetical protein [Bacilli bacterium]